MRRFLVSVASVIHSNVARLSQPYKVTFALTYHCNSRCTICNIWQKPHKEELSLNDIQRFFQANPYFTWVNLTGGELVLRQDLVDVVKIILQTQPSLFFLNFPTNGLLTEKIVQRVQQIIALHPPHFLVSVSLDGPEALHDQLRGIRGNWKRAIKTYTELKKLRSNHFDCYFGMTISNYNYTEIEKTFHDLQKEIPTLIRSDIHFNIAHYSSHYYGNLKQKFSVPEATIQNIAAYNKKKQWTFTKISQIESLYQRRIPQYLRTKKTPLPCLALSSSIFLDPFGNVFPCSMWNTPIGNIKSFHYDLHRIWNTNKTKLILKKITAKKCANCWTPCEAYQTILGNIPRILF